VSRADRGIRPDLVIFDIDGTVHDTFQWWVPVLRRGVAEFGRRTGIRMPELDDEAICAVVGMKDAGVWGPSLPVTHRHRWQDLREVVLTLEVQEICSGRDYLFPGVRPLLRHLRGLGVRTALASNCRSTYLEAVCRGQGLTTATDWQFCLDSDGVSTKTDMLRRAIECAGAGRPVMVGDREPDQQAAAELGMPFIWRVNSRCTIADAHGAWRGDPDELLELFGLPGISRVPDEA